jgi:hypothetical protein
VRENQTIMAVEEGCITAPPWDQSEACFLARKVLAALPARP